MELLVLFLVAAIMLLIGVPIGISLFLAMLVVVVGFDISSMTYLAQAMYTGLESLPLVAVPCFMLAGAIMETGGLSERIINVANKLVGHTTGGLGTVTILACLFFGAISGSAPATAAAIGAIMIPFMMKDGYDGHYAAGLSGVAGGLGIIVPPSIPLVIYAISTSTSVGDLFLAGIGPAIVVAVFLLIAHNLLAYKKGYVHKKEKAPFKDIIRAVWDAKWALIMPIIILGGIYGGIFTPTEAAVIAIVYGLIIGIFVYQELNWRDLFGMFEKNVSFVGGFMLTYAPAAALGGFLVMLGLPDIIRSALLSTTTNIYLILLILNLFLLLLGMFLDCVSSIVVFAPILYAVMVPMGIDPIHLGLIMVVNLAVGFVTPPVCMNLFVVSTQTGFSLDSIVKKALPLIIAMFLAVLVITFMPGISLGILQIL